MKPEPIQQQGKAVVYQVFTRLFGNQNDTNKPWGTSKENGVGKFADFDDRALEALKSYGVSHLWYTGVLHHAMLTHYPGITDDHPSVVKGLAGSPYAIKDYYNVNPDLATDPSNRLAEFEALIVRTHAHDMKVIIDIVPNHLARAYRSTSAPAGMRDFGADDNAAVEYRRDNNFYYVPGQDFCPPDNPDQGQLLARALGATARNAYRESPAKWTGDGARQAKPHWNDWFETVKVNYGIRPDGSYDFPHLPEQYRDLPVADHVEFWADKSVPDSWVKFRAIAFYWLDKGVDGFRYDMAEMVPVEFWSYLNSALKARRPDVTLVAEVYQPDRYRDYIQRGKIDYLYDKVDLYDCLKNIVRGMETTQRLDLLQHQLNDIDGHLLRFLENHDEQRIASPEFAGSAEKGWPAMVVTTLLGRGPTMLYFGQAQGEPAAADLGFGRASRTTIFDYAGVPAHQAWLNGGRCDGGALNEAQRQLDRAYHRLLNFSACAASLQGDFIPLHGANLGQSTGYDELCYSFARCSGNDWILVFVNFNANPRQCVLTVPQAVCALLPRMAPGQTLAEQLNAEGVQHRLTKNDLGDLQLLIDCPRYSAQAFQLLGQ
ncbi:alpha-amylase family protein [Reinekea sp.]|jgi:glycosidase|uniref:alpha-amylase family protein n=1 Tax=Reinekea sp. TaxID=1970455 RepID=UPI002A83DE1C|nr:alpha-amylase family protein [Reinekea sp.]